MNWKEEIKETIKMFKEGAIGRALAEALLEYEKAEERKEKRA